MNNMTSRQILGIVGSVAAAAAVAVMIPALFENVDANEVIVIQSVSGSLNCYTEPGPVWQGFGSVQNYPRRRSYEFDPSPETDPPKPIRFSDGGTGSVAGAVSWVMPIDCPSIIKVHRTFGSSEGIQRHVISKMVDNAIRSSGPTMSAAESAGPRLNDLVQMINDQAQNGTYKTESERIDVKDELSGQVRTETRVRIVMGKDGQPVRVLDSTVSSYGIILLPLTVKDVDYSGPVKDQIAQRQKAAGAQQLAIANANKAVQDAVTAEKMGEAAAATAKWEQEKIKAVEVVKAQQAKEVAEIRVSEAEAFKKEQILRGEGEATRKRLVMAADGNMELRARTAVEINKLWANAFQNYKGSMVPTTVIGAGGATSSATNMQSFLDMMTAKTAHDLSNMKP